MMLLCSIRSDNEMVVLTFWLLNIHITNLSHDTIEVQTHTSICRDTHDSK